MKAALILCLLSISLARLYVPEESSNLLKSTQKPFSEDEEIYEIIEGVLQGIASESEVNDIQDCLTDLLSIKVHLTKAISLFKQASVVSALEGLKEIKKAFSSLPKILSDCGGSLRDSPKAYHVLNVFENPLSFEYDEDVMVVNGVDIHKDIYDAIQAYEAKKWKLFGFYIGASLMKVQGTGIVVIA
ncbi:unnamed protein product [Blepharisma stoltei]|uniref:Ribophorin-2 n=1 Tax=Blepharisma stoltei TaxID=1481888 RepID=A0AAU9K5T6_9CILI|nr:unnamed protein product [Blepharisma stoltei]